jgi:hypothetical protein
LITESLSAAAASSAFALSLAWDAASLSTLACPFSPAAGPEAVSFAAVWPGDAAAGCPGIGVEAGAASFAAVSTTGAGAGAGEEAAAEAAAVV